MPRTLATGALAWLCAACAATPPAPPPGPVATTLTVAVADTGWHTDVCLRAADAGEWLLALPKGFDGARFLCFGFGDLDYMVAHDHSVLAKLRSLLPSRAAIVMTPLREPPAAFFGQDNATDLGISRAGAESVAAFIRAAIATTPAGAPDQVGTSPIPGRLYFAATGTYDGFNTCNTWTGDALIAAGLPVRGGALFASEIIDQVRALAAAQAVSAARATPGAAAPVSAGSP